MFGKKIEDPITKRRVSILRNWFMLGTLGGPEGTSGTSRWGIEVRKYS